MTECKLGIFPILIHIGIARNKYHFTYFAQDVGDLFESFGGMDSFENPEPLHEASSPPALAPVPAPAASSRESTTADDTGNQKAKRKVRNCVYFKPIALLV